MACLLTKFEGRLQLVDEVEAIARNWLEITATTVGLLTNEQSCYYYYYYYYYYNSLIGCTNHDLTDDWSLPMPISLTAYAHFAAHLGAFFYRTRFI